MGYRIEYYEIAAYCIFAFFKGIAVLVKVEEVKK